MNAGGRHVRALAFDLDGTLVDSAPDIGHALNEALRESGFGSFELRAGARLDRRRPRRADRARAAGAGAGARSVRSCARRCAWPSTAARCGRRWRMARCSKASWPCCRQLRPAWPLVVVTNKPSALARAVLDAGGLLPHFAAVYGADEAALRKPAPAMLNRAAQALGLATQQLLMVGDSAADMGCRRGGRLAGRLGRLGLWRCCTACRPRRAGSCSDRSQLLEILAGQR